METTEPQRARAQQAVTVAAALRATARAHPDLLAVRTADDSLTLTWAQLLERVDAAAGGLAALGVKPSDTVAIMLTNRPEFHIADLAAVTLGATPFSIYNTYPAAEIEYLIADAGARVAVVESAFLPQMLAARANLPNLRHLIIVDPAPDLDGAGEGLISLEQIEALDPAFDAASAGAGVGPDDLATLIYTSGTTGHPKGVELTHRAILAAADSLREIVEFPPGSRVVSWLPAAHIAERMAHHYIPLRHAGSITCVPDPRSVLEHLPRVHPNWFFAVPRIWEKLKAGLEAMQAGQPDEQRRVVQAAVEAATQRVRLRQRGEPVPPELEAAVAAADARIFAPIRAMLGLDEVRAVNVGAAPTPAAVIEFFHAIGIELAELWGMSETCGAGAVNRPGRVRIGTVGQAAPGVELAIAEDGEVLCRGAVLMRGYRHDPGRTAEALDADGWLHTGDIGHIDDDGYLTIVDRKKEIIINSAGKNMSPANIEAAIKTSSPLVAQAVCIGDARPYNTALILLDPDFAPAWAAGHGLGTRSLTELAGEAALRTELEAAIERANAGLARVEQIKRFAIVAGEWHPGGEELTPTLKLKRRPIAEKYGELIESLYAAPPVS
jgi:long-chain acyl-CoA synthetase